MAKKPRARRRPASSNKEGQRSDVGNNDGGAAAAVAASVSPPHASTSGVSRRKCASKSKKRTKNPSASTNGVPVNSADGASSSWHARTPNYVDGAAAVATVAASRDSLLTTALPPAPLPSLPLLINQLKFLSDCVRSGCSSSNNGSRSALEEEFERRERETAVILANVWDEAVNLKDRADRHAPVVGVTMTGEDGTPLRAGNQEERDTRDDFCARGGVTHDNDARSLFHLLSNHAPASKCLTVDARTYVDFLHSEDILSPDDLAEAAQDEEYLESVLASDGQIVEGMCHAFRDAVIQFVALAEEEVPKDAASPATAPVPAEKVRKEKDRLCRYGLNCHRKNCKYVHPKKECRFGPSCSKRGRGCKFVHPGDSDNVQDELAGHADNDVAAAPPAGPSVQTTDTMSTGWQCSACTFLNTDEAFLVCEICDTPRSSELQQEQQQLHETSGNYDAAVITAAGRTPSDIDAEESSDAKVGRREEEAMARKRVVEELARLAREKEEARKKQEAEDQARRVEQEARKRVEKEKAAAAQAKREQRRKKEEAAALEAERQAKAEEEKNRQLALAEKRAAIERYERQEREHEEKEKDRQAEQELQSVARKISAKDKSTKQDMTPSSPPSRTSEKKAAALVPVTTNKPGGKFAAPTRSTNNKTTVLNMDGPIVLYPTFRETGPDDTRGTLSPLFKMLRDPSQVSKARAILALEAEVAKLKTGENSIRLEISACNKQTEKIKEEYKTASEKRSDKEWKEMAQKQETEKLETLRARFDKDYSSRQKALNEKLHKKTPEAVTYKAEMGRKDVHAKYLAPLEAVGKSLEAKKLRIEKERDERLGIFRVEAIERNKSEDHAAMDRKHKQNLERFDKDRNNSLAAAEKERDDALAKLDKKRKGALAKIQRRETDRVDNIEQKRSTRVAQIELKRKEQLAKANLEDTVLRSLGSRFLESAEQRKKREAIEQEASKEKETFVHEMQAQIDTIRNEARTASSPIDNEYKTKRNEVEEAYKKKRNGIEEAYKKNRPILIEDHKRKRLETEEAYKKKRLAVEEERRERGAAIEQDFKTKMAKYSQEYAAKMKEVDTKRKSIQTKVDEEYIAIEREKRREMAEVEAFRSTVEQEFLRKEADYDAKKKEEEEEIRLSTEAFLRRVQMDDTKKAANRDAAVAEQVAKIERLGKDLVVTEIAVENFRKKLSEVKGKGQREEPSFDLNMKDHYGNTLLMVAAQRDDLTTAEVCLELGVAKNERNDDGLTALSFARYFKYEEMITLLERNGASVPKQPFDTLLNMQTRTHGDFAIDWATQLRISEQSAIPPDTFLASAEALDKDEDSRMPTLSVEEQQRDYSCFEARLLDPDSNRHFKRVILIEKNVYSWLVDADTSPTDAKQFLSLLRGLIPGNSNSKLNGGRNTVVCHRRAIVGVRPQFEVLCAALDPKRLTAKSTVVHFTPFVSSEVRGVADVGVLVWAISSESKASYVKALIEQSEFKRNKIEDEEERFLPHADFVMPLGKDMHLLDLKATSTWKSGPMTLFTIGVEGDLGRLEANDVNFTPKQRTLESERILREQLFLRSESELQENEEILHEARPDLSTNLFGGAGTGKTMLLIQKVASEPPHKKILVVSRLPRLVSFIRSGVKDQKGVSINADYYTYDELLTFCARRCYPDDIADERTFSLMNEIHFYETTGTGNSAGMSFHAFIDGYLTPKERSTMSKSGIEPLTLWTAIRVIKSHTYVARNKRPLHRKEYIALPKVFGLDTSQREVAYDYYLKYCEWVQSTDRFLWDEADRVLYCLKFGGTVFADEEFVSWKKRAFEWGEDGLIGPDGMPEAPFYHDVYVDEAQDFTDLDVALFIRLSAGLRSVFLGADPAQSVEVGIRSRDGGINDVFNACLPRKKKGIQVKSVLQDIRLKTNHRTHAQNLALAMAIRRVLTRSFCVPDTNENAISKGPIPEALLLKKLSHLSCGEVFKGANVVFIAPDENLSDLRALFFELGITNDVFGIREAKGLEFNDVALLGFFTYFEARGSTKQWQNCLRWLFSKQGLKATESSESVNSHALQPCDYLLTHPEIEDEAMMLYTAVTRARQHLYMIEDEETGKKLRRGKGLGLGDFAFRHMQQLQLLKTVGKIDAGDSEMTPQEHNARGVLLVTKAVDLSNKGASTDDVKEAFQEAADRFRPDKGCDSSLLLQCDKHLQAILSKRELIEELKAQFFSEKRGEYLFAGRFSQITAFETKAAAFVQRYIDDSFVNDEVRQLGVVIEDVFFGTPFWVHFEEICTKIKECCT